VVGEIESRIATLRAKRNGEAHDLTDREAMGLAGDWYRWFIAQHEDNPGEPRKWALNSELMTVAVMGATPYWNAQDPFVDQTQRHKEPDVREDVHPILADEASGLCQLN
jgi:hypothetical protein